MNHEVYYQPLLSDAEWNENRDFNTTDVFRLFSNAKARFPNNEIGAYSCDDIADKKFVDSDITMTCDMCKHVEHYDDEESFFQGEMYGLHGEHEGTIVCDKCLNKNKLRNSL